MNMQNQRAPESKKENARKDEPRREDSRREESRKDSARRSRSLDTSERRQGYPAESFMAPLFPLQREATRMMEEAMMNFFRWPTMWMPDQNLIPDVDVHEDNEMLYIETDLPDIDPQNIDVQASENYITISCDTEEESRNEQGGCQYQSQSLYRTVMLPGNVNIGEAEAEVEEGRLVVSIPKKKDTGAKGRRIPVRQAA